MLGVVAMGKDGKGAMRAVVGSNLYCSLLNTKSPLICIVGKQRKDHTSRSLNYCFFANQRVLFFAMPFLPHKCFALTGHLKTAKCECLWMRAKCQVQMFLKQPNRRQQKLLAVENKTILQQPKPSTFYIMFHLRLIFYPHHWHSFTNALHKQVIWHLPRMNVCEAALNTWLKHLLAVEKSIYAHAKNHQISTS